jgi:hypothetical protein
MILPNIPFFINSLGEDQKRASYFYSLLNSWFEENPYKTVLFHFFSENFDQRAKKVSFFGQNKFLEHF